MESSWVDFKAVKQAVTIEQILGRYGVKLRRSGKELRGRCPIHQGDGSESFHANIEKNAFHCFSCQAKGNILDFVAAMEKCSVRDAALKLKSWFGSTAPGSASPQAPAAGGSHRAAADEPQDRGEGNRPLGFTLKGIDHHHPYLASRGVDAETAEYFGVGFFSGKGSMSGRVVIPIENETGDLVAYAGRSIDGSDPKYKLPAGFKKNAVLYNLARAVEDGDAGRVVLVEGFFDCIRVTQAGYASVALMGCSLSGGQEELLVGRFGQVVVMLDGDAAGSTAAAEIAGRLARRLWVRTVSLPQGQQPDGLSCDAVTDLLARI